MADFKPNIYPIMIWGLMYGLVASFVLLIINFLSNFIALVWFPLFLAGVIWGGYRSYKKQKREAGQADRPRSAVEEFKEAAQDIAGATKEMVREQLAEAAEREVLKQGGARLSQAEEAAAAQMGTAKLPEQEGEGVVSPRTQPEQGQSARPGGGPVREVGTGSPEQKPPSA